MSHTSDPRGMVAKAGPNIYDEPGRQQEHRDFLERLQTVEDELLYLFGQADDLLRRIKAMEEEKR